MVCENYGRINAYDSSTKGCGYCIINLQSTETIKLINSTCMVSILLTLFGSKEAETKLINPHTSIISCSGRVVIKHYTPRSDTDTFEYNKKTCKLFLESWIEENYSVSNDREIIKLNKCVNDINSATDIQYIRGLLRGLLIKLGSIN